MALYSGQLYDTIVCFGDSLTQHGWDVTKHGWVAQLSQAYLRRLDVVNRGFSGFNSKWVRVLFDQLLPVNPAINDPNKPQDAPKTPANEPQEAEPDMPSVADSTCSTRRSKLRLFTILLGANDAQLSPLKQHVPLDEFQANIEYFVRSLTSPTSQFYSPDTRIILITPPPVGEKLWKERLANDGIDGLDRRNDNTKKYADAVKAVGERFSVPCIDLWTAIEDKVSEYGGYDTYSWDGVHLNANGNDLLFGLLMAAIRENFPELDPDSMPFVVPDHRSFTGSEDFGQLFRL
ncbi:SGNH hydrolase [Linderina pennispora]|uniref:SGNH hydrolase n=1 Tax=Linderina pennispora TaxID=61395 RepID=A0A1Y1W7L3_9FUNG|nr:SGNH hydrolase [Linderina pennispora]ORX69154.1 SGNH hydrolase [Linderina pennispora]